MTKYCVLKVILMLIYLIHTGFKQYENAYIGENMSLAYISSSVKQQGHVTRILDCMVDHWDEEMLVQELIEKNLIWY